MSVYKIIEELRATRSKLEKEAILRREINNDTLKEFFRLALNPFINFYQKKEFEVEGRGDNSLMLTMAWLEDTISKRVITGGDAIALINKYLEQLSPDDAKVIKMILQKNPDCGVQTTLDKVWPGLIPSYPCLLASPWDVKLAAKMFWSRGVIMQKKSDGLRCNLHIDAEGNVKAFTRAGNELNLHGRFNSLGQHFKDVVIDGELLTLNPETGKFNNRQTSNGICSRAIKNTMEPHQAEMLHLVSWDIIPAEDFAKGYTSGYPYQARLNDLSHTVNTLCDDYLISIVDTKIVHSIEEAQTYYQFMLDQGEEGAMAKDGYDDWVDKRLKTILKMKSENTADMKVIGFKEGEGKLKGNLGSLEIESNDGKCVASMSGFSLKLRSEIYANLMGQPVPYTVVTKDGEETRCANPGDTDVQMGSIIEVLYNQKLLGRDSTVWSLFLPRFSQTRHDKTVANNLEDLK